jgi:hypothetical protein
MRGPWGSWRDPGRGCRRRRLVSSDVSFGGAMGKSEEENRVPRISEAFDLGDTSMPNPSRGVGHPGGGSRARRW